jgi:hypothetical protein
VGLERRIGDIHLLATTGAVESSRMWVDSVSVPDAGVGRNRSLCRTTRGGVGGSAGCGSSRWGCRTRVWGAVGLGRACMWCGPEMCDRSFDIVVSVDRGRMRGHVGYVMRRGDVAPPPPRRCVRGAVWTVSGAAIGVGCEASG